MSKRLLGFLLLSLCACGDDDGGTPDSGGGGDPPQITMVSWAPEAGCTANAQSDFTITIEVLDADTPPSMLTFSGQVSGCSGTINANPATIVCPNAAPYSGAVTVTDPQGNSDTAAGWQVRPCEAGMHTPM